MHKWYYHKGITEEEAYGVQLAASALLSVQLAQIRLASLCCALQSLCAMTAVQDGLASLRTPASRTPAPPQMPPSVRGVPCTLIHT